MDKKIGRHLTISGPKDWSPNEIEIEISNVDIDSTTLSIKDIRELYSHLGVIIAKMDSLTSVESVEPT